MPSVSLLFASLVHSYQVFHPTSGVLSFLPRNDLYRVSIFQSIYFSIFHLPVSHWVPPALSQRILSHVSCLIWRFPCVWILRLHMSRPGKHCPAAFSLHKRPSLLFYICPLTLFVYYSCRSPWNHWRTQAYRNLGLQTTKTTFFISRTNASPSQHHFWLLIWTELNILWLRDLPACGSLHIKRSVESIVRAIRKVFNECRK